MNGEISFHISKATRHWAKELLKESRGMSSKYELVYTILSHGKNLNYLTDVQVKCTEFHSWAS